MESPGRELEVVAADLGQEAYRRGCGSGSWPAKTKMETKMSKTTATESQALVVVGPNLRDQSQGSFHVHAKGCRDLSRGMLKGHPEKMTMTATTRHDVEAFVYDFAADENEDYTLGDWQHDFHFAPCVTIPVAPSNTNTQKESKMNINEMTRDQLRAEAKERGLKTSGTKAELVARVEADEAAKAPKESKKQATRKGGRTLIPGYTLDESYAAVAEDVVKAVVKATKKGAEVNVLEVVESTLMDAADSKSKTFNVTTEMGRVLGEYLRQDRQDRYTYILTKVHQATGRALAAQGRSRRTGLPTEA